MKVHVLKKCSLCGENALGLYGLQRHRKEKHPSGSRTADCGMCGLQFKSFNVLAEHEEKYCRGQKWDTVVHESETTLQEPVSETPTDMETHSKSEKPKKNYYALQKEKKKLEPLTCMMCSYCGKGFFKFAKLKSHLFDEHDVPFVYKCNQCDAYFEKRLLLRDHVEEEHDGGSRAGKLDTKVSNYDRSSGVYSCEYCSLQFDEKSLFQKHVSACLLKENIENFDDYVIKKVLNDEGKVCYIYKCFHCQQQFDQRVKIEDHVAVCLKKDKSAPKGANTSLVNSGSTVNAKDSESNNHESIEGYKKIHRWAVTENESDLNTIETMFASYNAQRGPALSEHDYTSPGKLHIEKTPGEQTPGEQTPGEQTPGEQTPGEQTPGEQTPGEQTPGEQTPAENPPEPDLSIKQPKFVYLNMKFHEPEAIMERWENQHFRATDFLISDGEEDSEMEAEDAKLLKELEGDEKDPEARRKRKKRRRNADGGASASKRAKVEDESDSEFDEDAEAIDDMLTSELDESVKSTHIVIEKIGVPGKASPVVAAGKTMKLAAQNSASGTPSPNPKHPMFTLRIGMLQPGSNQLKGYISLAQPNLQSGTPAKGNESGSKDESNNVTSTLPKVVNLRMLKNQTLDTSVKKTGGGVTPATAAPTTTSAAVLSTVESAGIQVLPCSSMNAENSGRPVIAGKAGALRSIIQSGRLPLNVSSKGVDTEDEKPAKSGHGRPRKKTGKGYYEWTPPAIKFPKDSTSSTPKRKLQGGTKSLMGSPNSRPIVTSDASNNEDLDDDWDPAMEIQPCSSSAINRSELPRRRAVSKSRSRFDDDFVSGDELDDDDDDFSDASDLEDDIGDAGGVEDEDDDFGDAGGVEDDDDEEDDDGDTGLQDDDDDHVRCIGGHGDHTYDQSAREAKEVPTKHLNLRYKSVQNRTGPGNQSPRLDVLLKNDSNKNSGKEIPEQNAHSVPVDKQKLSHQVKKKILASTAVREVLRMVKGSIRARNQCQTAATAQVETKPTSSGGIKSRETSKVASTSPLLGMVLGSVDVNLDARSCLVCGKAFKNLAKFSSHTRAHFTGTKWTCMHCSQSIHCDYLVHLGHHMNCWRIGKNKKRFQCPRCWMIITDNVLFEVHMRNHVVNKDEEAGHTTCEDGGRGESRSLEQATEEMEVQEEADANDRGKSPIPSRKLRNKTQRDEAEAKQQANNETNLAGPSTRSKDVAKAGPKSPTKGGAMSKITPAIASAETGGKKGPGRPEKKKWFGPNLKKFKPLKLKKKPSIHKYNTYTCQRCGNTFQSAADLQEHLLSHTLELTFWKCAVCQEAFRSLSSYSKHVRDHVRIVSIYVCHICNTKLLSQKELTEHMTQHVGSDFICGDCDKVFLSMEELTEHDNKGGCHTARKLRCPKCNLEFKKPQELGQHLIADVCSESVVCSNCDKVFATKDRLSNHKCSVGKGLICPKCKEEFKTEVQFADHFLQQFCIGIQRCKRCKQTFGSDEQLAQHEQFCEQITCVCDQCGRQFMNQQNLSVHKPACDALKPFACNQCSRRFCTAKNLANHHCSENVGKKDVFDCRHCGRQFRNKKSLKKHPCSRTYYKCDRCKRHFLTEKNYSSHPCCIKHVLKCPKCEEGFQNEKILRAHYYECPQPIPKLITCPECRKGFPTKNQFSVHLQQKFCGQTQVYDCRHCTKEFFKAAQLSQHKCAMPKMYACTLCSKDFPSVFLARKHQCESPKYPCNKCDDSFVTKKALASHEKSGCRLQRKYQETRTGNVVSRRKIHDYIKPKLSECVSCAYVFGTEKDLADHYCDSFGADEELSGRMCNAGNWIHCSQCGGNFGEKEEFDDHDCKATGMKKCPGCRKYGLEQKRNEAGIWRCTFCNIDFDKFENFAVNSSMVVRFECYACLVDFESTEALAQHDCCQFSCLGCKEIFRSKAQLDAHTSKCRMKCSSCRKVFANEDDLATHVLDAGLSGCLGAYMPKKRTSK
jgi:KRAB domain-containing zinc finger protein